MKELVSNKNFKEIFLEDISQLSTAVSSFTTFRQSPDCWGRGRLFLQLLSTSSTHFTETQTLLGNYGRALTSVQILHPNSNQQPLVSERELLS